MQAFAHTMAIWQGLFWRQSSAVGSLCSSQCWSEQMPCAGQGAVVKYGSSSSRLGQPPVSSCSFVLFNQATSCLQFIKDARDQLWLVGLHSITFDPQHSRGSAATFTESWGEFLAGAGPPPAPHLSQHTSYGRPAANLQFSSRCSACSSRAAG
jgi:hypothetical protein